MADKVQKFGNDEYVLQLGPNEKLVWDIYQDYLYCIDATIVPPASMATVSAILTLAVVTAVGLSPGGKP